MRRMSWLVELFMMNMEYWNDWKGFYVMIMGDVE